MRLQTIYRDIVDGVKTTGGKVRDASTLILSDKTNGAIGGERSWEIIQTKAHPLMQRIELSIAYAGNRELGSLAYGLRHDLETSWTPGQNYLDNVRMAVILKELDRKYNFQEMIKAADADRTNPAYLEKAEMLLSEMADPISALGQKSTERREKRIVQNGGKIIHADGIKIVEFSN